MPAFTQIEIQCELTHSSPLNPFPLPLEQAGEGDPWGLMTGAKALFCLTAGNTEEENGRMEEALEEPTVGLEDITAKGEKKIKDFSSGIW